MCLLKSAFKTFLSKDQILDKEIDLKIYDTDATSLFKQKPKLVLLPNNTEEVAKIIQAINKVNLANKDAEPFSFVARGAGTGLSGGAIAAENSVIISLARLNRLISFNEINRTALVETGIVNATLSSLVISLGSSLHFSPDPSSQDACTIGGNVAENAGGIHCFKHGLTSDQILGLEIVTAEGEIKYLGALTADGETVRTSSIDLAKLFTGSEGTFGIATKALVHLQAIPESFITMKLSFASIIEAAKAVSAVMGAGFKPTALEMIDYGAIQAVNSAFNLGIPENIKAILLLELDGDNDEILIEAKDIKNLLFSENIGFTIIHFEETQDPLRKNFLWKVRKGTVAAFGQIAPFWYLYDSVVPRSKIPEAVAGIEKIAKKYNLILASVMHAADGNLHPNFLYDPDKDPDAIERIHHASKELMQLCIDLGGVLSGEHGIGVEKQEYMPYMFTENDMEQMLKVKKIFDPKKIANPNKIFPIRICKNC